MTQRRLPPKATTALGEEAATELAEWVTDEINIVYQQSVSRDEYRKLLSRIDILEHDVSDLKVEVKEFRRETNMRLDAMEERFDARFDHLQSEMNARFDRLYNEMDARFSAMNQRIDTIHDVIRSQTRWLVGTLIAVGGLISVLITIFNFIS